MGAGKKGELLCGDVYVQYSVEKSEAETDGVYPFQTRCKASMSGAGTDLREQIQINSIVITSTNTRRRADVPKRICVIYDYVYNRRFLRAVDVS